MAEVSAFINARPFIPVSNDPDMPEVLTPATLLTQQPQQLKQPAGDFIFLFCDYFCLRWLFVILEIVPATNLV